jgi:hypothetical protein
MAAVLFFGAKKTNQKVNMPVACLRGPGLILKREGPLLALILERRAVVLGCFELECWHAEDSYGYWQSGEAAGNEGTAG